MTALAAAAGQLVGGPLSAAADDLEDFGRAHDAYQAEDYALSAQRFEQLVGGATPRLQNEPLILEARKYLAASYLFLDRRPDAENQFALLLRAEPTYELDPIAFPREVLTVFASIRERIDAEREAEARVTRERQEQAARLGEARARQDRERLARLTALASTETIEQESSRAIASIPFGVGQFQNGDETLGWTFAITEGALAILSIVMYILNESLRDEQPDRADIGIANDIASAFAIVNWISTTGFAAVAIGGIIEAQLSFVPSVRTTRERELPQDLLSPDAGLLENQEQTSGAVGLQLRLRF